MSKGSNRRPGDNEAFREGWDRVFNKEGKATTEAFRDFDAAMQDMAEGRMMTGNWDADVVIEPSTKDQ